MDDLKVFLSGVALPFVWSWRAVRAVYGFYDDFVSGLGPAYRNLVDSTVFTTIGATIVWWFL